MAKEINIEEYQEHKVSEVICVKCGIRWLAVNQKMMIKQKDIDDLVFRFKWSKESFKDKRVTDIYRQGIYDVVELLKQRML